MTQLQTVEPSPLPLDWEELPGAPVELSGLPAPGRVGRWYKMPSEDFQHLLVACVMGDGGAEGPFQVAVYCVPVVDDVEPRYASFPEIWDALFALTLEGAVFAFPPAVISEKNEPPTLLTGSVMVLTQTGCADPSPAATRMKLSGRLAPGAGGPS